MTRYTKTLIVLWIGLIVAAVAFCVWPGPVTLYFVTLYFVFAVPVLIVTALVHHRSILKRNGA